MKTLKHFSHHLQHGGRTQEDNRRNQYAPESREEKFIRITQYIIAGVLALCGGVEVANILIHLVSAS